MPRFSLLSRTEYFSDLTRRLQALARGDHAELACMTLAPTTPAVTGLVNALCSAAQRGARVQVTFDAISYMISDGASLGPLFFHRSLQGRHLREPFASTQAAHTQMQAAGVHVTLTNQPNHRFSLPIAGRSHIKYALLNDRVYLGGCNLDYPTHSDMMLAWHDPSTATWLRQLARSVGRTSHVRQALGDVDIRRDLDDQTSLFVDVGRPKQSQILDQAYELIDQAHKHLYMTCQYFPTAATVRHLRAAVDRGVKLRLIYNNVANAHAPRILHYANFWLQKQRLPASFFSHQLPLQAPYLHAKILASEKSVLLGSHNYVTPGVRLGTAEIALLRHDPAFAAQVPQWFDGHVLAGGGMHNGTPIDAAGKTDSVE